MKYTYFIRINDLHNLIFQIFIKDIYRYEASLLHDEQLGLLFGCHHIRYISTYIHLKANTTSTSKPPSCTSLPTERVHVFLPSNNEPKDQFLEKRGMSVLPMETTPTSYHQHENCINL
jgi:hypothetical protein